MLAYLVLCQHGPMIDKNRTSTEWIASAQANLFKGASVLHAHACSGMRTLAWSGKRCLT